MRRNWFIFYGSFLNAGRSLPTDLRMEFYERIVTYWIEGNDVPGSPVCEAMFALVKPQLDANNKRYENGEKGGEFWQLGAKYWQLGWRPKKIQSELSDTESQTPEENPPETPLKPRVNPPKEKEKEEDKEKGKGKEECEEKRAKPKLDSVDSAETPRPPKSVEARFFSLYSDGVKVGTDPELGKMIAEKCRIDLAASSEELAKFADYWNQKPAGAKKANWEKQKTFELFARLRTWLSKSSNFPSSKAEADKTAAKRSAIEAKEEAEDKTRKIGMKRERDRLLRIYSDYSATERSVIQAEAEAALSALWIVRDPMPKVYDSLLEWKILTIIRRTLDHP